MEVRIEPSWKLLLADEFEKPYFSLLADYVRREYSQGTCYPPAKLIFNAFDLCPLDRVKVVIVGQDPYHEPRQAEGLSFSVPDGVDIPPSLRNIISEIDSEYGTHNLSGGSLRSWARQGVLLLNSILTVRAHQAGSHQGVGWETFTDRVISELNKHRKNIVYMLWGSYAQHKGALVDIHDNLILKSAHPSPLSAYRGFIGNGHFRKANEYLIAHGIEPIVW